MIDQTEKLYVHALCAPLHEKLLRDLRADSFDVVDLRRVSASPILPLRRKLKSSFTITGLECLGRAILEFERRYCGNKTECLQHNRLIYKYHEMLATMIDPRTLTCKHLPEKRRKPRRDMYLAKLKKAYVVYAKNAQAYHESLVPRGASADNEAKDDATGDAEDDAEDDSEDDADTRADTRADTGWSDDDDIPAPAPAAARPLRPIEPAVDWGARFDSDYKNFRVRCSRIDWPSKFPDLDLPTDQPPDLLHDLIYCDLTVIFNELIDEDPDRSQYGFLPYMATGFEGSVSSLLASSFSERVNSCANLVLTDGNSLLQPNEINMLVVLRMNREFMIFMRKYYGNLSRQQFAMTVVSPGDNGDVATASAPPAASAASSASARQASIKTFLPAATAATPRTPAAAAGVATSVSSLIDMAEDDDDDIDELLLHSADPFHVSDGKFQGPPLRARDNDGHAVATAACDNDDDDDGDCAAAAAAAQEPDY